MHFSIIVLDDLDGPVKRVLTLKHANLTPILNGLNRQCQTDKTLGKQTNMSVTNKGTIIVNQSNCVVVVQNCCKTSPNIDWFRSVGVYIFLCVVVVYINKQLQR